MHPGPAENRGRGLGMHPVIWSGLHSDHVLLGLVHLGMCDKFLEDCAWQLSYDLVQGNLRSCSRYSRCFFPASAGTFSSMKAFGFIRVILAATCSMVDHHVMGSSSAARRTPPCVAHQPADRHSQRVSRSVRMADMAPQRQINQ